MKTIKLVLMLSVISFLFTSETMAQAKSKANKDTQIWRYELEGVKQGVQGSYLVKVWSYSKKPEVAIEQAKKNAVHGVIFRGFAGTAQQKPITNNVNLENEQEAFFKDFFKDGGRYLKYVNVSGDGTVSANDKIKVSKKEWKIGVIVSVNQALLRKDLEAAGIIKGLGDGF
jgi:hypothetical protein